jgi:hypothetical protein
VQREVGEADAIAEEERASVAQLLFEEIELGAELIASSGELAQAMFDRSSRKPSGKTSPELPMT